MAFFAELVERSKADVWKLPSTNHRVDSEGASRGEEGIGQFMFDLMSLDVNDTDRTLV